MKIQAKDLNIGTPVICEGRRYVVEKITSLSGQIKVVGRDGNRLRYWYLRPYDRLDSEMVIGNIFPPNDLSNVYNELPAPVPFDFISFPVRDKGHEQRRISILSEL